MERRLESWKEIAAHFGRRVRTVQRWEKDEGLPVHRHDHRLRATVHAIPEELDVWWERRTRSGKPPSDGDDRPDSSIGAERPSRGLLAPTRRAAALLAAAAVLAAGALAILATAARRSGSAEAPVAEDSPTPGVLEARYLLNRGSAAEVERAMALCSAESARADSDPRASARERAGTHECLAQGALARVWMGRGSAADGLLDASREAAKALALDPRRANAAAIAAWAAFLRDWDALAAEAGYRRAIALDPAAGLPHHALAHLLSGRGRHGEAILELRRAQRSQPLSATLNDDGCWFFYRARRYEEGIAEAERALRLEPQRVGAMQCVLDARAALGQHREAREAAVSILRILADPEADALAAAPAEQALARFDRRMVERLDDRRASLVRPSSPYAFFYGELGDKDRAIAWLERAAAERDPVLLLVRVHPAFDSLRGDPRLEPLLRRAGV